jgi:hypothetical protein
MREFIIIKSKMLMPDQTIHKKNRTTQHKDSPENIVPETFFRHANILTSIAAAQFIYFFI